MGWQLVVQNCACDAHLVGAVVAGQASADRLAVIKFGNRCNFPVCRNHARDVAAFAGVGGVQMGDVFRRDGFDGRLGCAVVTAEAGADRLRVIEGLGWCPWHTARGMAGIAGRSRIQVGCRLVRDDRARQAQFRRAAVAGDAGARHLRVVNLRCCHIPVGE